MLYRAFLNILLNAIQAMKDGGTLTIITEKAGLTARPGSNCQTLVPV